MALAYLLARRGVGVTVLESHPDFTRAFRGEGFQQSGIDAVRQMGLGRQFERLPQTALEAIEMYRGGRLVARVNPAQMGRDGVRVVSQPDLLAMLADEAGRFPSFRLEFGVTVRGVLSEGGRVVGVRADTPAGPREYRADLVVGADGRHSATRKHGAFAELMLPQGFDILWVKVPFPESGLGRTTIVTQMDSGAVALAYPTADGQLQLGFVIPKGTAGALRGQAAALDDRIRRLPPVLAAHMAAHRDMVARATLLNVVCGRLTNWTAPGLLLIGDAAHPMSPVGGQGLNVALRDALVAANHLCPALVAGGDGAAIDAAARRVQEERMPEIVAIQEMQQKQSRVFFDRDRLSVRLGLWLMPLLLRVGLLARLNRRENAYMSRGVVPVRLTA
jgi:2-polyprenyl-6-methoxyphenol hydroxylase-like FAD-dependent oxidoreductase